MHVNTDGSELDVLEDGFFTHISEMSTPSDKGSKFSVHANFCTALGGFWVAINKLGYRMLHQVIGYNML